MHRFHVVAGITGFVVASAFVGVSAKAAPTDYEHKLLQGLALFDRGKLAEAEPILRDVHAAIAAGKHTPAASGRCLAPLISICLKTNRFDEALRLGAEYDRFLESALRRHPAQTQEFTCQIQKNLIDLAGAQLALGRTADALAAFERALALRGGQRRANPLWEAEVQAQRARLLEEIDRQADAREAWEAARKGAASLIGPSTSRRLPRNVQDRARQILAAATAAIGDVEAACKILQELLAAAEQRQEVAAIIQHRRELAVLESQRQQWDAAQGHLAHALAAIEGQRLHGVAGDLFLSLSTLLERRATAALASQDADLARELAIQSKAALVKGIKQFQLALDNPSSPPSQAERAGLLERIKTAQVQSGNFDAAIEAAERLLKSSGPGLSPGRKVAIQAELGALYARVGRAAEAKPLLEIARAYYEQQDPASPAELAFVLNNQAAVARLEQNYAGAQQLFEEALELRRRDPTDHPLEIAECHNNLASLLSDQGMYAQAVVHFQEALALCEELSHQADALRSTTLLNLAMAYKSQGQLDRATDTCQEALDLLVATLGPDSVQLAPHLNALAALHWARQDAAASERCARRALELCSAQGKLEESVAAASRHQLALVDRSRKHWEQAEAQWREALRIQLRRGEVALAARTCNYLASIAEHRNDLRNAEEFYQRALELEQTLGAFPGVRFITLTQLARLQRNQGKRERAIELYEQATQLTEVPRAAATGAEAERAEYFSQFAAAFDALVDLYLETGQLAQAFQVSERGRTRTMLDELQLAGVNPLDTVEPSRRLRLMEAESASRRALAEAQSQALEAARRDEPRDTLARLAQKLADAQKVHAEVNAEIRSASSLYRHSAATAGNFESLSALQAKVLDGRTVVLRYFLGSAKSHLFVIGPAPEDQRAIELRVTDSIASAYSESDEPVPAGPLTRDVVARCVNQYVQRLQDRSPSRALVATVTSPKGTLGPTQATALAAALLPEPVRVMVQTPDVRRVVLIPDGSLHDLPFESLLLEAEPQPRFVLDTFPPIAYAPSATILLSLIDRPNPVPREDWTVLSVGNPAYQEVTQIAERGTSAALADAYVALGGQLPLLPGTAVECRRLLRALGSTRVALLEGADATERNVREHLPGRRWVHLAAHGFVDHTHDNLFGAIALTPPDGPGSPVENDGFLALHEIYTFPLEECELALLSACQTNVGPGRPLEAGSTLAQAFLSAGARRVISSYWNVDDASTAELMGTFFDEVADLIATQQPVDYAAALWSARRKLRNNPDWSLPYYWAPFVLIGPGG